MKYPSYVSKSINPPPLPPRPPPPQSYTLSFLFCKSFSFLDRIYHMVYSYIDIARSDGNDSQEFQTLASLVC